LTIKTTFLRFVPGYELQLVNLIIDPYFSDILQILLFLQAKSYKHR